MAKTVNAPLATSWFQLLDIPAMVVEDMLLLEAGISDAREWEAQQRQMKAQR